MRFLVCVVLSIFFLSACSSTEDNSRPIWVQSNCDSLPAIEFKVEEIRKGLEIRHQDSVWAHFWNEEYKRQLAELENYNTDSLGLFPYQEVDSALFYFYEPVAKEEGAIPLNQRKVKDVRVLCVEKVNLLLNIINNPLNFGTGECGTDIPVAKIVLFHQKKRVGEIVFGCNYSMISTMPENPMITGGLTEEGDRLLEWVKPWK